MEIEELPDLKIDWFNAYHKYRDVSLLEYVWEVANYYLPNFDETEEGFVMIDSDSPARFANRYFERNLSPEERYERNKAMGLPIGVIGKHYTPDPNYRKLDDSFKEKFLENEDLQNTIEAFGLDVSKFWYLLLFIYDFIEDFGKNAPALEKNTFEDINDFNTKLLESTSITLKKDNRKSYTTERKDTILFINAALQYYIKAHNDIINEGTTREYQFKKLKEIGWNRGIISNNELSISLKEKTSLDISYKKWKLTDIFLHFLEDRKATVKPNTKIKVSKDKMMFISRLIYTVGYHGKEYNKEYDEEGNPNRMLSNLLRRYRKEKFPSVIANYYNKLL